MAHQLEDARAIIAVRSRRHLRHRLQSNIVWTYANATLPRALRDVIVTEYGVADIRGKSDRDTIAAMICVADGNFQHQLKASAQRAGKIERSFSLPSHAAANRLQRLQEALGPALGPGRGGGLLPAFPLGSDMTDVEESLTNPLLALKRAPYPELLRIFLAGSSRRPPIASETVALERMGLAAPRNLKERALRALVLGAFPPHPLPI